MGALIGHREDQRYFGTAYAKVTFSRDGVDWDMLAQIYARAPLADRPASEIKHAFTNSYLCCFAWVDGQLVGAAQAASDGVYYATIPDVAVDPALQGGGIDRRMMTKLLRRLHVQKGLSDCGAREGRLPREARLSAVINAMDRLPSPDREVAVDLGVLVA